MNLLCNVLPSSWLSSTWYATLTAFVAVNTLVYVVLSVSKVLPRVHPTTWLRTDSAASRRRESRSIFPERPVPEADAAALLER